MSQIVIAVTAASTHDNQVGIELLDRVAIDNPTVAWAWLDSGLKNKVAEHGVRLGTEVTVV